MLRKYFAICITAFCLAILVVLPAISESKDDFLSYENASYHFRIKYPPDWMKKENYGFMVGEGSNVYFFSPEKSENLAVVAAKLPSASKNIDTLAKKALQTKKMFAQEFTILDSSSTTIANLPAIKYVYIAEFSDRDGVTSETKGMLYYLIENDNSYVIEYTARPSRYKIYIDTVDDMVKSLEIY
jgi:hypothetical protein